MGIYGIDFYGVGRFGRDPSVIRPDFSVAPFVSMPLDYSTLHLTWHKPHSPDCVNLRLVRNARNLPQTAGQPPGSTTDDQAQADGLVLFTDVVSRPFALTDANMGQGFYYYTMFGWSASTQSWVRCTDLIALVPINWGYGYRLYHLLPMAYRDQDIILVDPFNPWEVLGDDPPLKRYMNLIGFQMDFLRTELESLLSMNDPLNCSGALLPLMANQLALAHEPEIGMQQERQLIQNAIHLYKQKGSPRGLTEFTSIMTSYPATGLVHHGYNVMLTHDDSSFADGIGTWQLWPPTPSAPPSLVPVNRFPTLSYHAGVTLSQVPNLLTASPATSNPVSDLFPGGMPISLQPPYGGVNANSPTGLRIFNGNGLSTANSTFSGGTTGTWTPDANTLIANSTTYPAGGSSLQLKARASGNVSVNLTAVPPIVALGSYTANCQVFIPSGTARQAQISIKFYNASSALVNTVSSSLTTEVAGAWTTVTVTGNAGSGATYANLTIQINGLTTTTEAHYVDNVNFYVNSQDTYLTTGPIPVTDFMSSGYQPGHCTFRVNMYGSTVRTVYLSLWGDVGNGTPVPISAEQNFQEQPGKWTEMHISSIITPYPTQPPAGTPPPYIQPYGPAAYYWIYPRVRIGAMGANETHYMTLGGVWNCRLSDIGTNTGTFPYDYPRDVKVVLQPQSANLLSNTLTTFTRTNPTPPPSTLRIGFDGLTALTDPTQGYSSTNPYTGTPDTGGTVSPLSIRYASAEDDPGTVYVNGNAALEMDVTGPGGTVWFGKVTNWSAQPPNPLGWFAPNWFPGAHAGSASARPWVDANADTTQILGWFSMPEERTEPPAAGPVFGNYFGVGTDIIGGVWFPLPPQATQYNNLSQYNVQGSQPFNFSIYARYISAVDPSNAGMLLGFRWIYPDGNHIDVSTRVQLTTSYERYAIPPPPYAPIEVSHNYLAEPPPEGSTPNDPNPPTGTLPTGVFPFVQFPNASKATFYLNSAMLSPTITLPGYMDSQSYSSATGDFLQDPSGASLLYNQRTPRVARLNMEMYRWIPMGSTYTVVYASAATMPPLDPTTWP